MRQLFTLLLYFGIGVLAQSEQRFPGQRLPHDPYSFACSSAHYMLEDFAKQPRVPSPDLEKAVQLTKEGKVLVTENKTVLGSFSFPDVSSNLEIGWSPDSSQFFISYSDGGVIGAYHVHLYRLLGGKLVESQIPSAVAARFKAKHWCEARGNNLFFLDWTPDSKIGFFVVEVNPDSDCGSELATFRGYAVDLQKGTILRVISEKETKMIESICRKTGTLTLPSR